MSRVNAEPLLNAREAMALLGCCRSFLTEHAAELGAIKMGGRLKFTHSGLAAYQERQRVKPPIKEAPQTQPKRRLAVVGRGPLNPIDNRPWDATTSATAHQGRSAR